jgi:hypothetical protein
MAGINRLSGATITTVVEQCVIDPGQRRNTAHAGKNGSQS